MFSRHTYRPCRRTLLSRRRPSVHTKHIKQHACKHRQRKEKKQTKQDKTIEDQKTAQAKTRRHETRQDKKKERATCTQMAQTRVELQESTRRQPEQTLSFAYGVNNGEAANGEVGEMFHQMRRGRALPWAHVMASGSEQELPH